MKPEREHNWTPREELDWLAFRYVANELSEGEAAEFERRLADDQSAREAVARSVQLTHAVVSLAEPAVTAGSRRPSGRQQVWAWIGLGAAAAAVCLAFWLGRPGSAPSPIDTDSADHKVAINRVKPSGASIREDVVGKVITAWTRLDESIEPGPPAVVEEPAQALAETESAEDGQFDWVVAALGGSVLSDDAPPPDSNEEN